MARLELIEPDWPAPANVRAFATTRAGGTSRGAYASLNLGNHVDDDPGHVRKNRRLLSAAGMLPAEPAWLKQIHGREVLALPAAGPTGSGDGAMTGEPEVVCAVLTADCLPVLICDRHGQAVAAIHAGWRGLAAGILETAVAAFAGAAIGPQALLAWLGPAIGVDAYEVGTEVRAAFELDSDRAAFRPNERGRWQCDLYALARSRLAAAGVDSVHGGSFCTFTEVDRFYSYRRDGRCGRQASMIWLERA